MQKERYNDMEGGENMTQVVAALIWEDGKFLACQRPAHKARGLLWEFVGGKVESGESREAALVRECREELDVTVEVGPVFMKVLHEYPDITIELTLFYATIVRGELKLLEHNAAAWVAPEEIAAYEFCPADEEILRKLRSYTAEELAIRQELFALRDAEYKAFHEKLMPNVDPDTVLGVRMPQLRKLAKRLQGTPAAAAFLAAGKHDYYEEMNLHGLLLMEERDFTKTVELLDTFLSYVNNWATCDLLKPKAFQRNRKVLLPHIKRWIKSENTYVCRFAMSMLMTHFLDGDFLKEYLDWVAGVESEEYYVNMMQAWYFATALAKQWDAAVTYLQENRLCRWVHNKTIQKAVESYRITEEQKAYLKTLKRK